VDYRTHNLQSADNGIEERSTLRTTQIRWHRIAAAACTVVLVLIIGSPAVLESRQTAYRGALLRSFGPPVGFSLYVTWSKPGFSSPPPFSAVASRRAGSQRGLAME